MKPKTKKDPESVVREIKINTRCKFKPDEKIRITLVQLSGAGHLVMGFVVIDIIGANRYYITYNH